MDKFKLELSSEEVNYIYNLLIERPYKEVSDVAHKIIKQVNEQKEESDKEE